jgi:DNA replication protein DnaC
MTDPTVALVEPLPLPRRPFESDDEMYIAEAIELGTKSLVDIPIRYQDATVTVPAIAEYVRSLVARSREVAPQRLVRIGPAITVGKSLLIIGPTGVGKSFESYGVIRALAVSGARVNWVFTSAADCYAKLRPRPSVDSEHEFERYANAGFLVLDDLGAAKSSEWVEEINYRLINFRYEREKPTLVTSNVQPKDLKASIGDRVASRLVEMADRVVLSGPDRRRT